MMPQMLINNLYAPQSLCLPGLQSPARLAAQLLQALQEIASLGRHSDLGAKLG